MKKDGGEKPNQRPPSTRSPAFPRPGTAAAKSKQLIESLTNDNEELQGKVVALTEEGKQLRETWLTLATRLVENAKEKGFQLCEEEKDKSLGDVSVDSLIRLINSLTYEQVLQKKKSVKGSVESRIEELETRITQMNMNLANLLQSKLTLEHGLEDIQQCSHLDDAKHKARFLLFETKGSEIFTFLGSDEDNSTDDEIEKEKLMIKETKANTHCGKYQVLSIVKDLQTFELSPPVKKLPGDTAVSQMDPGLQHYLVSELSLYKSNGADWRMMAERVGISVETIAEWQRWRLELPMQHVLQTWAASPSATMRMLHRHLVSPQMKAILLARRISDFYLVD